MCDCDIEMQHPDDVTLADGETLNPDYPAKYFAAQADRARMENQWRRAIGMVDCPACGSVATALCISGAAQDHPGQPQNLPHGVRIMVLEGDYEQFQELVASA
jgi:hypothetical protein